jgi:hypothetical protein
VLRRAALLYLALASPLVLLTFVFKGVVPEILFTALAMAFPVALIIVGVTGRRAPGPLTIPLLGLLVILEGSGLVMLAFRGRVLDGPWLGGLPLAAGVQLYVLFLGPLLLVALAYAFTFERFGIRDEDLQRLKEVGEGTEERN